MVGRALASVVAIVAAVDAQYGPYQHWWNVAMSADGQTVVGLTGGTNFHVGYPLPAPNVFRSTDSGTHFTQVSDDGDLNACSSGMQTQCTWMGVSCSADCLFVAAVSDSGFLYWGDFPSGGWARSSSPVLSYKALVVRANPAVCDQQWSGEYKLRLHHPVPRQPADGGVRLCAAI